MANLFDPKSIIHVDNHQLVICKTVGILTQPSGTDQDNLLDQAKNWLKIEFQKPGNVFLEAVHRIDKPVSGLVLFARTSKALSRLSESVREKRSNKTYLAYLEGIPKKSEDVLENYLIHDDFHAVVCKSGEPGAKLARLSYKVISTGGERSLVEINLETGRYHQIRVQFAAIGCPIVGDAKYGSKQLYKNGAGIMLHHKSLSVPHPITGELQEFVCDPDWENEIL